MVVIFGGFASKKLDKHLKSCKKNVVSVSGKCLNLLDSCREDCNLLLICCSSSTAPPSYVLLFWNLPVSLNLPRRYSGLIWRDTTCGWTAGRIEIRPVKRGPKQKCRKEDVSLKHYPKHSMYGMFFYMHHKN